MLKDRSGRPSIERMVGDHEARVLAIERSPSSGSIQWDDVGVGCSEVSPNWFWFRTSHEHDGLGDSPPFNTLDPDLPGLQDNPGERGYRAIQWDLSGGGFTSLDSGDAALSVAGGVHGAFLLSGSYILHVAATATFPVQQEVREVRLRCDQDSASFPIVRNDAAERTIDLRVGAASIGSATPRVITVTETMVLSDTLVFFTFEEDDIDYDRDSTTLSHSRILEVLAYRI